jgi:ACS family hexuronate transporter-like MFS transporter
VVVPFLYEAFGWRGAFVATGASGFAWLMAWLLLYRMPQDHPRVSPAELQHIQFKQ